MRLPIEIGLYPRRCALFGHRTHHGLPGVACLGAATVAQDLWVRALLILAGTWLVADDWPDRRVWLPDFFAR